VHGSPGGEGMAAGARQDYKVVILGASGVGKTCVGLRFVKDQFVTYTASTIGASFLVKELVVNGQRVTLQIWDTAGQERFRSMAPLYYRGAVAAILVFSITDDGSFEKMKEWVRELQANVDEPLVLAIAANKADLVDQRVVSADAATQYAASIGALVFETSAKSSQGARPRRTPSAPAPHAERARAARRARTRRARTRRAHTPAVPHSPARAARASQASRSCSLRSRAGSSRPRAVRRTHSPRGCCRRSQTRSLSASSAAPNAADACFVPRQRRDHATRRRHRSSRLC
jgi:small GTP-binding protein